MTFSGEVDRRQRLVASARALAEEAGSAAFTVAHVAAHAGLSLKAFYSCFRSKDDLLIALLAADSLIGAEMLAQRIGDRTGEDALRAYVFELFDLLTVPGAIGYAGVLVREHRRLSEAHSEELRDALAPLVDLLARNIGSEDAKRDARTMFTVLLDGVHDVVVGIVADTPELAEYLARFCIRGVGR
jgi:AcrR family transcriptional regulator